MFRPLRRKKRAITDQEARELLVNCKRGIFAVNGDDGYPYAIPVNYYFDPEHAIGKRAHQARFGPAVYQRVPVGANPVAQFLHRRQKCWVVTNAGAQVYRDVHMQSPSS